MRHRLRLKECALVTTLVAALACVPGIANAQRGGAPPYGGPPGSLQFQLSDGDPISFYLEWARELELTDDQRSQLIELRRRLRQTNAPFMRQLDSLRDVAGVQLGERRRVSEEDRAALERFQSLSRPVADSIRMNNDQARSELRNVLQPLQLARADSLNRANRDLRGRRPPRP